MTSTFKPSFSTLELDVIRWAEERDIIKHSKPIAQAVKTVEEASELLSAVFKGDLDAAKDGIGDVFVTIIVLADLLGTDVTSCLELAYNEIKDRKGRLNAAGIFVKETPQLSVIK